MFRLFRNLKPMAWVFVAIVLLVTGQAVAELYLPEKMSEIIDDGIYIDYEPLYKYEEMERPSSLAAVDSDATLKGYDEDTIPVFEMVDGFSTYDLADAIEEEEGDDVTIDFVFRDIPVKDSKELFDNVLTPFLEGLEIYQRKAFEWRDLNVLEIAEYHIHKHVVIHKREQIEQDIHYLRQHVDVECVDNDKRHVRYNNGKRDRWQNLFVFVDRSRPA